MRTNKQGKDGGNAVDEEGKRQVRAMGEECAFDAPGARRMCAHAANAGNKREHPNSAIQPTTPQ